MMLDISRRQNSEHGQKLARARSRAYSCAKRFLLSQFVLVTVIQVAGTCLLLWAPEQRFVVSLTVIACGFFDALVLDRQQRALNKEASQVSEMFDCFVLNLRPNAVLVGSVVGPERIEELARDWNGRASETLDWYPAPVTKTHLQAQLICQRANLWYDFELRSSYVRILIALLMVALLTEFGLSIYLGQSLQDFVSNLVVPSAPFAIWATREVLRHTDAAQSVEKIKASAEKILADVSEGKLSGSEGDTSVRQLQDCIFVRRCANPLMLPALYKWSRGRMETKMVAGAAEIAKRRKRP